MSSNWEIDEKYSLITKLGQGSYGSVYSAKDNLTGELVAIKELKGIFDDFIDARRMLREICIMIHLNHPCIIKIKEVIVKPNDFSSFFIVMEHAETDLKKLIRSPTFLDHEQVRYLLYQAVVGIRYMHSANILHRDLKPANILINSDCSLKICDFGLSRSMTENTTNLSVVEEEGTEVTSAKLSMRKLSEGKLQRNIKRQLSGHVVTRWYRAPELILLDKNYDKEIDVWSLGCVYAELLSMIRDNAPYYVERGPIFPGKSCFPLSPDVGITSLRNGYPANDNDQLNVIMEILGTPEQEDLQDISNPRAIHYIKSFNKKEKRSFRMFFAGSIEEEIEILEKMLVFSRKKRISIDQLLEHPYFNSVRSAELEILASVPANFEFDRQECLTIDEMKEIFMKHISTLTK